MGFETSLYCNWGAASCGFDLGLNLPWMVRFDLIRCSFSQGGIFFQLGNRLKHQLVGQVSMEEHRGISCQSFTAYFSTRRVFSEQCLYLNIPKPSLSWWKKNVKITRRKWSVTATATFLYQATYGGVWSLKNGRKTAHTTGWVPLCYKLVYEIPYHSYTVS